jgi:hypothetical protein
MAFKNYGTKEKNKEKKDELNYKVLEKFGQLDSDSKMPKELRLISWNGGDPKYDIRGWSTNEDGTEKMTKGITLDAEELQSLYEILKEMDEEE